MDQLGGAVARQDISRAHSRGVPNGLLEIEALGVGVGTQVYPQRGVQRQPGWAQRIDAGAEVRDLLRAQAQRRQLRIVQAAMHWPLVSALRAHWIQTVASPRNASTPRANGTPKAATIRATFTDWLMC